MSDQVQQNDHYAVIGNPVSHSLSPRIHKAFAEQTNQDMSYEAIELDPDKFIFELYELQQRGLQGLNVTVPFKQAAWALCDNLSPRAEDAGAVNTVYFTPGGEIVGDNTDGAGLTRDLVNNHHILIARRKVLILGAGGAARGVLAPLLALKPESITIANRSIEKARLMADDFKSIGEVITCGYDDLGGETYDLIINATSTGLNNEIPPIPDGILGFNTTCYDMMYRLDAATAFVQWGRDRGAAAAIDGLGMLVEQAAESFYIWRGLRVDTTEVINSLRQ